MTNDTMTTKTKIARPNKAERAARKIDETGQWNPVRLEIEIRFGEENRRVTPADLERAATAAMTAARTSLEGRNPAYLVSTIRCRLEYLYVQTHRMLKG